MLNLVFGRHFGFAKCQGLGGVKGVGMGRESDNPIDYIPDLSPGTHSSHATTVFKRLCLISFLLVTGF